MFVNSSKSSLGGPGFEDSTQLIKKLIRVSVDTSYSNNQIYIRTADNNNMFLFIITVLNVINQILDKKTDLNIATFYKKN